MHSPIRQCVCVCVCTWIDLKAWSNYLEKVKSIHYWLTCFCYWAQGEKGKCSCTQQQSSPTVSWRHKYTKVSSEGKQKYHSEQAQVRERQWSEQREIFLEYALLMEHITFFCRRFSSAWWEDESLGSELRVKRHSVNTTGLVFLLKFYTMRAISIHDVL